MISNRNVLSDSLLLGLHKPKGTICSHKDEKGRFFPDNGELNFDTASLSVSYTHLTLPTKA